VWCNVPAEKKADRVSIALLTTLYKDDYVGLLAAGPRMKVHSEDPPVFDGGKLKNPHPPAQHDWSDDREKEAIFGSHVARRKKLIDTQFVRYKVEEYACKAKLLVPHAHTSQHSTALPLITNFEQEIMAVLNTYTSEGFFVQFSFEFVSAFRRDC
jgi:hypothetical protein